MDELDELVEAEQRGADGAEVDDGTVNAILGALQNQFKPDHEGSLPNPPAQAAAMHDPSQHHHVHAHAHAHGAPLPPPSPHAHAQQRADAYMAPPEYYAPASYAPAHAHSQPYAHHAYGPAAAAPSSSAPPQHRPPSHLVHASATSAYLGDGHRRQQPSPVPEQGGFSARPFVEQGGSALPRGLKLQQALRACALGDSIRSDG